MIEFSGQPNAWSFAWFKWRIEESNLSKCQREGENQKSTTCDIKGRSPLSPDGQGSRDQDDLKRWAFSIRVTSPPSSPLSFYRSSYLSLSLFARTGALFPYQFVSFSLPRVLLSKWIATSRDFKSAVPFFFFFFLNLFPKAISRLHACHKTRTKENEQGNFVTSNLDFRWSVQNGVREIVFYLRDNRTICVHITIFRMWLVFHNAQGNSAIIRSRY